MSSEAKQKMVLKLTNASSIAYYATRHMISDDQCLCLCLPEFSSV